MADVLTKAGVLLAIIVLAYALKRIGVFQTADYQILSKLVFRLSLPCAVITAFSEGFQRSGEMYLLALFGLGVNIVLWGCCYLACRKRGESSCAFYTQSVAGYNIGAFTLPFIQSFLGSSGVVIACMFDMGNSVMCKMCIRDRNCGAAEKATPPIRFVSCLRNGRRIICSC